MAYAFHQLQIKIGLFQFGINWIVLSNHYITPICSNSYTVFEIHFQKKKIPVEKMQ